MSLRHAALWLWLTPSLWCHAQWISLNGGLSHAARSFALSADGTRLLVGGSFPYLNDGAARANNLAWWDGQNWSLDGLANGSGDTSEFGNDFPVLSTTIRQDTLFLSMLYDSWQQDQEMGFATMLVDGEWEPCGSPEGIFFFLEANGRLFGGGQYSYLNGGEAYGVQEWRGGWHSIPNMPFTEGVVQVWDVEYWHGQYYFGGAFAYAGCQKVVAFDGVDQWSPLAQGVGGSWVATLAGFGDSLYAGGYMLPGPNVQSRHLQIWDGTQWLPFFDEVTVFGKTVDMKVHDDALWISGLFLFGDDPTYRGLIRFDGTSICAFGGAMSQGGGWFDFFNEDLYMGLPPTNEQLYYEHIGYLDLATVEPDTCLLVNPSSTGMRAKGNVELRVYPNPAQDQITLELPAHWTGPVLIELSNGVGQLLFSRIINNNTGHLPLEPLGKGIYSIRVKHGGETSSARVVVTN
jgi:hypothetical protein